MADKRVQSVVVIAYYFPPDGGAAAYRPLRFVRHLGETGWRASVVTRDASIHDRFDPDLLQEVPPDVEITRVRDGDLWQAFQARRARRVERGIASGRVDRAELQVAHQRQWRARLRRLVHRAEAWCYYPDTASAWIGRATRATAALCRRTRPDALLVTGGPWSSFLVARNIAKQCGTPYVLDFRDSWTLTCNDEFEALRPKWAPLRDRWILPRLFREARAVVFRYESEAECYWNAYPGALTREKIHIIPNGYEGTIEPFAAARGDRCTLLYTGTVGPYRYDTFLDALSTLRANFADDARHLRVLFFGEGTDGVARAAAANGLGDIVEVRPPVPSAEVARLQQQAHALFLLGVKPYQGYELCGSKVFNYLKAGRPILGVLPADESRRVLAQVGVSTIADTDSRFAIVSALRRVIGAWRDNTLGRLVPDPRQCAVYAAPHQTRALACALEGRAPATPFVPGTVEMPASLKHKIGEHGWITQP